MKRLNMVTVASIAMAGLTWAQSATEKESLKTIGKGFMVFSNANMEIVKYEYDGNGGAATSILADSAFCPSLSPDGKTIAYAMKNPYAKSSVTADIYLMNRDGSNVRKLNTTPLPYVSMLNFANDGSLLYTSGPKSVRTTEWAPQLGWKASMAGKVTKLIDYSSGAAESYMSVTFLDMHDNLVTWRYNARAYAGTFAGGTKASDYKDVFDFGQACGNAFNPAGDMITINSIDHKTCKLFKRNGTSWTQAHTVKVADMHTNFRWSNDNDVYIAINEATKLVTAFRISTQKQLRISWVPATHPETGWRNYANLYLDKTTIVAGPPRVAARTRKSPRNIRIDLNGRLDQKRHAQPAKIIVIR